MTGITSQAIVGITRNIFVFIVHIRLIVLMTIYTTENAVITRINVALGTRIPFTFMFTAIDREELVVMIESRGLPGILTMTILACRWKLRRGMWRIIGLVIVIEVTPYTGIRRIIVITLVAYRAVVGDLEVSTL
jgi:hypothetical protein